MAGGEHWLKPRTTYMRWLVCLLVTCLSVAPSAALTDGKHDLSGTDDAAPSASSDAERLTNGTPIGAWTVVCEAVAVGETTCALSQRLVRSSEGTFLEELLAFWNRDPGKSFLVARVPMGDYLPSGFVWSVEEDEQQLMFEWQSCAGRFCEALLEIGPDLRTKTDAAGSATVGYRPASGAEPIVFTIPTNGLLDGLQRLHDALDVRAE